MSETKVEFLGGKYTYLRLWRWNIALMFKLWSVRRLIGNIQLTDIFFLCNELKK
jgi:hypothetical protein